ncbi:MAG: arginine--tRNA ligase, partial [Chthoniobacterales bacterium]
MPTVRQRIEERLRTALTTLDLDPDLTDVTATADSRFGDYQTNAAMVLAKSLRRNPRDLAAQIAETIDLSGIGDTPTIAGPGFLNFRLSDEFLATTAADLAADPRLGVTPTTDPRTIVIDFSAPNVAKPMHVGHIRSTFIGDALSRIARCLGHRVITDNHIGDWGTQFGKVIYGWKNFLDQNALEADPIPELLRLYRQVNSLEETDEALARAVREELVKLQSGDPENLAIWQQVVDYSWQGFERFYSLLGIKFDERLGESAYRHALAPLVDRLLADGTATISEGAACIFFPDDPDLAERPCLIRKSDGGFLYATTDLATIEDRVARHQPDAIWYVTGAPQALHFQQIFAAARKMGHDLDTRHVAFGSILGSDRKIMRTRSGENVQLADVLTEAVDRAHAIITEKNPDLPADEIDDIAKTIGLGAVKYAELSQHRMTDYIFAWDKMLSFQGNTAPYLQNAYVRIQSIFRKADAPTLDSQLKALDFTETPERALAIKQLQFAELLPQVLTDFRPNLLANYLYDLATTFHAFY